MSHNQVMNTKCSPRLQDSVPLGQRVAHEPDAAEVAAAVVALCFDVDAALRPIIGQRGVSALFKRSVHVTAATHTWLAEGGQGSATELEFAALEPLFSRQPPATALSCGNHLLLTFRQLLVSLIGESLTERLLPPTWAQPIAESPTQDSSS